MTANTKLILAFLAGAVVVYLIQKNTTWLNF